MTAVNPRLFREKDLVKLNSAHPLLKAVVLKCAENGPKFIVDQTVRGRKKQEEAHKTGHSNAHFGQSAHNYIPALAVDIYPVTDRGRIIWQEQAYRDLAVAMFAAAKSLHVDIDWGGDWKSLKDLPHFELAGWKSMTGKTPAP